MKLIIASNNAHKIYEIKKILSGKFEEILSLREAGISHETVEDGTTFIENALKKAREIAELSGCAALADDSGICAHALGGEPGIYSARYAGDHSGNAPDEANNALLLKNLAGKEDRSAHYTAAIALVYPDGREVTAEGYMYGKDELEHIYGEWMGEDIPQSKATYEMMDFLICIIDSSVVNYSLDNFFCVFLEKHCFCISF